MTFHKYVREFDNELPLETATPELTHPDVATAQQRQNEEQREQRITDIRVGLDWLRGMAKALATEIKCARKERDEIQKRMARFGERRDQNRLALALVLTTADITVPQRFGMLALLRNDSDEVSVGKVYGITIKDPYADGNNAAIATAAAKLVSNEELSNLREQGF